MKCIKRTTFMLLIMCSLTNVFSQEETETARYNGLAIDVFPLLNQIFSDDGSSSLFQLTYLWGRDERRFEQSIAPQYQNKWRQQYF